MIAIIDYGAGNLGSVYKAFRFIGADVQVTDDPAVVARADALVLPGVGAFGHCMSGLERVKMADATRRFIDSGRPFLGICVGLQMLFEESEETSASAGLGILGGRVVKFRSDDRRPGFPDPPLVRGSGTTDNGSYAARSTEHSPGRPTPNAQRLKVPHIGWNQLEFRADSMLFRGLDQGERVYFVHSYYPDPANPGDISAWSDYGGRFCCAVESGNVYATQFHPEKSGNVGLQILRNFVSLTS